MKYEIKRTSKFKQDYKRIVKRGYKIEKLKEIIQMLADGIPLPQKYNDHVLSGEFVGFRECHIEPNWLLIYTIEKNMLILTLTRTGTHSDLLNM